MRPTTVPDACTVFVERRDRETVRLLAALDDALVGLRRVELAQDPAAAAWVDGLACGVQVTPVVSVAGLVLFAPRSQHVLDEVRRRAPHLLRRST